MLPMQGVMSTLWTFAVLFGRQRQVLPRMIIDRSVEEGHEKGLEEEGGEGYGEGGWERFAPSSGLEIGLHQFLLSALLDIESLHCSESSSPSNAHSSSTIRE